MIVVQDGGELWIQKPTLFMNMIKETLIWFYLDMEVMLVKGCLFCESQNLAMDLLTFAEGLSYTKSSAISLTVA